MPAGLEFQTENPPPPPEDRGRIARALVVAHHERPACPLHPNPRCARRPYTPLQLGDDGRTLSCRGRTVTLSAATGLPAAITSNLHAVLARGDGSAGSDDGVSFYATPAAHSRAGGGSAPAPLRFAPVDGDAGLQIRMGAGNSSARWSRTLRSAEVEMTVEGAMDYDGHLDFAVILSTRSETPLELGTASLVVALDDRIARFADGGGLADNGDWFPRAEPSKLDWSWSDFNRNTWDPRTPAGG